MSDRPIRLFILDNDPVFRLGLQTALEPFEDLQVVAQANTADEAFEQLPELVAQASLDLIILDLKLESPSVPSTSPTRSGLQVCQQLKQDYRDVAIFLLSAEIDAEALQAARRLGLEGYCPKGIPLAEIVNALRQIAAGQPYWHESAPLPLPSPTELPAYTSQPARPAQWLARQRKIGLQQIDEQLSKVEAQLAAPELSTLDWLFWTGVRRELRTSRWLVDQLLPVEVVLVREPPPQTTAAPTSPGALSPVPSPSGAIAQRPQQPLPQSLLDDTLAKIQSGVENRTNCPLEIEILQLAKQRELLYIVLKQIEETLEELRFLQITPEQLPQRRTLILQDLWQSSTVRFFSKYYAPVLAAPEYQIVDLLVQALPTIEVAILDRIPLVSELFAYLLFEKPLVVESVPYRPQSPEARARAEAILHNLAIRIANAVMQLLLNQFAGAEAIKSRIYRKRFLSTREVARFRNELSWRYRQEYYFEEPKAIFESRHRLFIFQDSQIRRISIYAPRQQELEQLRGVRWSVTILLEARDAIAPRLRTVISWLGSAAVYVLTRVLGRAIGLVGRGIIQGIGNALQDIRQGKQNHDNDDRKQQPKAKD